MDIRAHNRKAWDRMVADGSRWASPVSGEDIQRARQGDWHIVLTPNKPVPADWLQPIAGREVLCLAASGGQQAPILAAAGAQVTVLDNSPAMLELDRRVAERDGLKNLRTLQGDMADLGRIAERSFDLVVNPVSTCFVPDLAPVWSESFRVLRPGGALLTGFMNPAFYIFDADLMEGEGRLEVANKVPYADARDLPEPKRQAMIDAGEALEFSHTLESQLGGLLAAGFLITGFYEDVFPAEMNDPLSQYLPTQMACRAWKPAAA
jgi:SAM-dependent methyltransferase